MNPLRSPLIPTGIFMAEEILIAELRAATDKFDRDLKRAAAIGQRAGKDIAKGLGGIEGAVKGLPANFKKFNTELNDTANKATKAATSTGNFSNSLGSLKVAAVAYIAVRLANTFASQAAQLASLSESLQGVNLQLRSALGSTQLASNAFDFVRRTSQRLAQDTLENAKQFAQLAISAKDTILQGDALRLVYLGITETAAAFKRSQDEVNRAFIQVNQGIRNQRFELEDLKTINEAGIPILSALQKALNIDGAQLKKNISAGLIGINEIILATGQLRKEFGSLANESVQNVSASFRRMFDQIKIGAANFATDLFQTKQIEQFVKTVELSFANLAKTIDKQQLIEFFSGLVRVLESVVLVANDLIGIYSEMSKAIRGAGKAIQDFAKSQTKEGVIGKAVTFLEGAFDKADKALRSFTESIGLLDPDPTVKSIAEIGDELGELEDAYMAFPETITPAMDKFAVDTEKTLKKVKASIKGVSVELILNQKDWEDYASSVTALMDDFPEPGLLPFEREQIQKELELSVKDWEDYASSVTALMDDFPQPGLLPFEREEQDRIVNEYSAVFRRAAENIQDTLGDAITNALRGQTTSIKDFGKSLANVLTESLGQAFAASIFKSGSEALVGKDFFENGQLGGAIGELVKGITSSSDLFKDLGAALKGVVAGFAAGGAIANIVDVLGGNRTQSAIAAGITGAFSGGATAAQASGGNPYAIAAGVIAGGLLSALPLVLGGESRRSVAIETVPFNARNQFDPGQLEGGFSLRTPFGTIGAIDSRTRGDEQSILQAVAEVDRAIARIIPKRMRDLVSSYFSRVSIVEDSPDAQRLLQEVVQDRLFDTIAAVSGSLRIAETVVGARGSGGVGNIEQIQRRAQEALNILTLIEEYKAGPLTEVGQAIKSINDQFEDLIISAEAFGISTTEIVREQARLLNEITKNFNADIQQRILEIEDPAQARRAELRRRQLEEVKEARDAGADLNALRRLHNLERRQLEEELADVAEETNQAIGDTANQLRALQDRARQFVLAGTSPVFQQLASLRNVFLELSNEARRLGESTAELTRAYLQQRNEVLRSAQVSLLQATAQIVDPFQAGMSQLMEQVREFKKLVAEGIVSAANVRRFQRAAASNLAFQEANRLASGGGTPRQQFDATVREFLLAGAPITDTQRQLRALDDQFRALGAAAIFLGRNTDGLRMSYRLQRRAILDNAAAIRAEEAARRNAERTTARLRITDIINSVVNPTAHLFDLIKREVTELADASKAFIGQGSINVATRFLRGQLLADEALNRISGGNKSSIEQVADAFDAFIRSGRPLTNAGQQLFNLTETFLNLTDAAQLLGLSTRDLERSYTAQARTIRDQLIAEIDASLESRRQVVQQANEFFNRLKLGDELPNNLRFDEAQRQFRAAAKSGDLSQTIASAQNLRDIARTAFGSTSQFFDTRTEILNVVNRLRQQEHQAIQAERDRLIRQETRDLERMSLQRSSLDSLQRIQQSNSEVSLSVQALLREARNNNTVSSQNATVLKRIAEAMGA